MFKQEKKKGCLRKGEEMSVSVDEELKKTIIKERDLALGI